ncbi:MAG: hypothetical protein K5871_09710 [Lachnospiraceae bacterium]|nr:hypothetical protein [Lachnospiraceae bacterium]
MEKKHTAGIKTMSMKKIVLVSAVLALLITFIYCVIEGIMVHSTGHMPFEQNVIGGECVIYEGVFWRIELMAPLQAVGETAYSGGPKIFLSGKMLIVSVLIIFAVSWTVLCLIGKKIRPVLVTIGTALVIYLLIIVTGKIKTSYDDTPTGLSYLRIYTTDLVSGHYIAVDYPSSVLTFVKAGEDGKYGRIESSSMSRHLDADELTRDQFKALLNAVTTVRDNGSNDRELGYTYQIVMIYDTHGGRDSIRITGYGGYPEGWSDLVRITNEICGGDYLSEEPETAELTADWYAENFGVSDDDLPEGVSVEDYLRTEHFVIQRFSGVTSGGMTYGFDAEKALNAYLEKN